MGKPFTKGGKDGDVGKGKDKGKKGLYSKGKVEGKGKDGYRPCDTKGIEKGMDVKGKDPVAAKGKGVDGKGTGKGEKGKKGKVDAAVTPCLGSKDGKGKGKDTVGKSQGGEMAEKGEPKGSSPGSKDGKGHGKQGDKNGKSGGPMGQKGKGMKGDGDTPAPTGTVGAPPTTEAKDVVTTPAKSSASSGPGGGIKNIYDSSLYEHVLYIVKCLCVRQHPWQNQSVSNSVSFFSFDQRLTFHW